MSQDKLPIGFAGFTDYLCLVCSKGGADRHLLVQEEDAHRYNGLSWHRTCFNVTGALRAERQALLDEHGSDSAGALRS